MRVIGAGFGRTGTLSLKAALEQLGFAPCLHMIDLIGRGERVEQWSAAAAGRPVDWRALMDGYEATVDWPGCTFYAELMAAFPDAKVVLTVRDPDAWYESVLRTIYVAQAAARSGELSGGTQAPPSSAVMEMIASLIWDGTFAGRFTDRAFALDVFERHNEAVKATVPADRLLVHEIAEGWDPLVRFLGVERPETPFPRLNDTAAFREMIGIPAS
jgi:hypothetical protein